MAEEGSPIFISFDAPSSKIRACINCSGEISSSFTPRNATANVPSAGHVRVQSASKTANMGKMDPQEPKYSKLALTRLIEQIALLEARIEELEKPKQLRTTLPLQNPYPGERRSTSLPALSRGGSAVHLPVAHSRTPSPLSMRSEGIPLVEMETLSQFGFFLHVENFREAIVGQSGQRPAAGLLDVVYLWAIHLSGSEEFITDEAGYLSRALRTAADALSGTHANTVLHSIQTEVLLANYFLRNTRFLEGKYVSNPPLIDPAPLTDTNWPAPQRRGFARHQLWAASNSDCGLVCGGGPLGPVSGPAFHSLTPPRDVIDECERINALWTVLTMNNCWTTADGSPSNISYTDPQARIDTPWPVDIDTLDLNARALPDSSFGTVSSFLGNVPDGGVSEAALHAKAAILFEQASRLASQYRPNMNDEQLTQLSLSFNAIDTLIDGFKLSVRGTATGQMHSTPGPSLSREMLLHNPFIVDNEPSRLRVLDAARAVVADLVSAPVTGFVYVDPIMGTLLMATCQVFVTELGRLKSHRPFNDSAVPQEERSIMDAIDTVLAVMNVFAPGCRLMNSQLIAMQQLYHAI
ncbi:hypothetical protein B0H12DRAFT_1262412 [Mycena haematopus]|nr:hypothetical protein B0H12DRAFT_1262412 [Mycena haematopus]